MVLSILELIIVVDVVVPCRYCLLHNLYFFIFNGWCRSYFTL